MQTSIPNLAEIPKMYQTEKDISEGRRLELNALMNLRLASAVGLQTQRKQAHWNVKGPSFNLSREDKWLWFVEAHSQAPKRDHNCRHSN